MKKIILFLVVIVLFAACSKWSNQQKNINKIAIDGTWIISSYIDSGDDETADFTTFRLVFMEDGTLKATDLLSSNSNTYAGTWSVTDTNADDNSLEDLHFNINFLVGNNLDKISEDWEIISYTKNEIKLIDVSGGLGSTDFLTLTKP